MFDKPAHSAASLEDSPAHLLHRVLQIALDIYNAEMGEDALSQRQYAVLKALEGGESGGLSQADLVRLTGIDRSTLADLVARMTTKNLLARERSVTDGRANLVQLTEAGRAALADAEPRVLAADEKILSLLSPPKRESFVKLLRKVVHMRESEAAQGDAAKDKPGKDDEKKAKALKRLEKKADKKKKKPDDAAKSAKAARKLKKLPMPHLSEGADAEEPAVTPEDKPAE
ncbi:MarR family transcriptional regulator [Asticcacaulis sp. EMRT-3]|uniref:MarR family winged helix-turn-helix transcriptional regulator n=1 Tax=Asticcacaulis sp. EMRT-3 TaxID=3040349 RepID=UPI0024AF402A|nr:MarR family transcriptional regulator [Asticcacaulis sp. EMRT-3]MDI7775908.1 MarR family transcriptional regulator [Asticcacaulis sp. EMRT-3]